ncbi:phage holin family protein [Roseovarius sp.]|uniref:phage holin family protein n=1 Tax=Roseovarius sp. TaxID=1486281 RepID=UPI0035628446
MSREYESMPGSSPESISDLIRNLATDLSALFGREVALAKSEMRESVSEVKTAVGALATGVAIAMAGLVVLLMSGVYGLSNLVAPWLAALIVGAVALLVGFLMVRSAKETMSTSIVLPERTLDSAKKDKEALQRTTQ